MKNHNALLTKKQWFFLIGAVVIGIVLGIGIGVGSIVEIRHVPVEVEISPVAGVSIGTNALDFGSIPPTGTGARKLSVQNDAQYKVVMRFQKKGETAQWLRLDRSWVLLEPQNSMEIGAHLQIPPGTQEGNFTGAVVVITHRLW